jgi:hypothetical protein
MTTKENRIFAEAVNGFGFEEVDQSPDGVYCTGCLIVHKRPTKMYQFSGNKKEVMCKSAVVRFYNPEDM